MAVRRHGRNIDRATNGLIVTVVVSSEVLMLVQFRIAGIVTAPVLPIDC